MAELNENLIKFGWLTFEEMMQAIQDEKLDAYDVCYCKDTHEQYLISSNLEPVPIKSRVRLYGSVEQALSDIQDSPNTYAGELVSVRDGEKFIAYIVNQFADGTFYIAPVCSDGMIDYNSISNVPIKNLEGSVTEPIVLSDLTDGYYKVTGHFITPTGKTIHSIVGNMIVVDTINLTTKNIKRISSDNIFDYAISTSGVVLKKYITDEYLIEKGYVTKDYVDSQIAAMDVVTHKELEQYVAETCTLLIKHLIDDDLQNRYANDKDIEELFV